MRRQTLPVCELLVGPDKDVVEAIIDTAALISLAPRACSMRMAASRSISLASFISLRTAGWSSIPRRTSCQWKSTANRSR